MRRRMLVPLGLVVLVLAACEIRTDYDLAIAGDASATLEFEMFYDSEAAELFGPAEQFLEEEIRRDVGLTEDGVTLLSAAASSSEDGHRVNVVFSAEDGEAFDRLVDEMFAGSSFTSDDGTTWTLFLRSDEGIADDLGEEFDLGEFGLDFISGEVRIDHAGSQVSMSGGTSGGGDSVVWDPYGADDLRIVMDLSGATPPGQGGGDAAEQPEPADEAAEPEGEGEAAEAQPEEPVAEEATDELDAIAAAEEDEGGLSMALLAGIIAGLLFLAIVVGTIVMMNRRGKHAADVSAADPVPAAVGAHVQGRWDQTRPSVPQPPPSPEPPVHPTSTRQQPPAPPWPAPRQPPTPQTPAPPLPPPVRPPAPSSPAPQSTDQQQPPPHWPSPQMPAPQPPPPQEP